jgi:hypothetical protein
MEQEVICPNCGLPVVEGDLHMILDAPDAQGNQPLRCHVKIITFNKKWLGVIEQES